MEKYGRLSDMLSFLLHSFSILLCNRIQMAQKEYLDAFNDELEAFKGRIRTRAKQKLDEAIKQHEEVKIELQQT